MTKLRKYLKHSGITQKRLAEMVGTTQNNLGTLVSGKSMPGIIMAMKIEICTGGLVTIYDWVPPEIKAFTPNPHNEND